MTPFQSLAWIKHWQEIVGRPLILVKPQLVHVYNSEKTVAILPLGIQEIWGIKILQWLGGVNTDYMGPLIHPDFNYNLKSEDLWQTIKSRLPKYDVIHFQKQPDWVVEFFKKIGLSYEFKQDLKAYKTELPSEWDTLYGSKSAKTRQTDRRKYRQLEKEDKVEFVVGESEDYKRDIIYSMFNHKRRRYRETGVWDMLAIEEYRKFYEGLATLSSNKLKIHCSALNVGNVKAATHVGFIEGSTFYYLMPAYVGGQFKKYSPSHILLMELMQWSIANGLKFFDFTIGDDAYKKIWCNVESSLHKILKTNSLKGWIYITFIKMKSLLKKSSFMRRLVRTLRF